MGHRDLRTPARDTVWREDDQQAHAFDGPRAMATFRDVTHITDKWRHDRPKPPTLGAAWRNTVREHRAIYLRRHGGAPPDMKETGVSPPFRVPLPTGD
jgi:hypothetical protein